MIFSGNFHHVEGARIFWRSSGRGSTLVLVHGYLVSHRCWERVLEPLAEQFSVVALDLPGFGESDCPPQYPYTIDAFSHSVAVLLDSLGLSRVTLIGHSLGSAITMNMALRYPERIERTVLVSPVVYPLTFPLEGRLALLPVVGEILFKRLYSRRDMQRYFRRNVYFDSQLPTEQTMQYYWERFIRPGGRQAAYRALQTLARLEILEGMHERLTCPTLIVWGEEDRLVSSEHIQRLGSALPQGSLFTIARAGHALMEERPEEFCHGVLPFLQGL